MKAGFGFFAAGAILLLSTAQAASSLGCIQGARFSSLYPVEYTNQTSRQACQVKTSGGGQASGYIPDTLRCVCSQSYSTITPSQYGVTYLTPGVDPLGNCASSDLMLDGQASGGLVFPQFAGCFSDRPPGGTDLAPRTAINQCAYSAKASGRLFLCYGYSSATLDLSGLVPADCSAPDSWLVAAGTPPLNPSLYHKRANQAAMRTYRCPHGQKACLNYDSTEYECLDTTDELESCGGCVHGEYQNDAVDELRINGTAVPGIDCTALPGVDTWAVGCSKGVCEVRACLEGWTLVDGECGQSYISPL